MRKSGFFWAAVLMSAVFLATGCSKTSALEVGEDAIDFTLNDVNGKSVNLSDFRGKVIILNFFASWCPPCRMEVPDFIDLQKAYGDKGFAMVGVALVELNEARSFAAKMGINYPVLVDDDRVSLLYGPVRSIPTTFIIGKDFRIARRYIGYRPKDVFENDIKALLK